MLKKSITYTDYNGVERTENFYFNLSQAELLEMELGVSGGYVEMLNSIVEARDVPTLIKLWKKLILKAYGEKTPDGKRFVKSEELSEAFSQTEAYSNLFVELSTNTDEAIKFANGVIPAALRSDAPAPAADSVLSIS